MSGKRRATLRTELTHADAVAAALVPDNTPEMSTRVEDGTVVTTIERETTGGLQSTVDDYVVNLSVATQVVQTAERFHDTNHE
ncbi:KEOPS complex Pcc1-like subunit [halophilic archaeon]|nr:KEOPS complex Pcc1-like subunit [halophilic archaeon]